MARQVQKICITRIYDIMLKRLDGRNHFWIIRNERLLLKNLIKIDKLPGFNCYQWMIVVEEIVGSQANSVDYEDSKGNWV